MTLLASRPHTSHIPGSQLGGSTEATMPCPALPGTSPFPSSPLVHGYPILLPLWLPNLPSAAGPFLLWVSGPDSRGWCHLGESRKEQLPSGMGSSSTHSPTPEVPPLISFQRGSPFPPEPLTGSPTPPSNNSGTSLALLRSSYQPTARNQRPSYLTCNFVPPFSAGQHSYEC